MLNFEKPYSTLLEFFKDGFYLISRLCNIYLDFSENYQLHKTLQTSLNYSNIYFFYFFIFFLAHLIFSSNSLYFFSLFSSLLIFFSSFSFLNLLICFYIFCIILSCFITYSINFITSFLYLNSSNNLFISKSLYIFVIILFNNQKISNIILYKCYSFNLILSTNYLTTTLLTTTLIKYCLLYLRREFLCYMLSYWIIT